MKNAVNHAGDKNDNYSVVYMKHDKHTIETVKKE